MSAMLKQFGWSVTSAGGCDWRDKRSTRSAAGESRPTQTWPCQARLEGLGRTGHGWFQEGREVDEGGEIVNYRTLDSTTRRLGKWPVEQDENGWTLAERRWLEDWP